MVCDIVIFAISNSLGFGATSMDGFSKGFVRLHIAVPLKETVHLGFTFPDFIADMQIYPLIFEGLLQLNSQDFVLAAFSS